MDSREREDGEEGAPTGGGAGERRTRQCALDGCDRRFVPASNRQKFCGPAHQQQAQALRRRPVDPELPLAELEQIRDDAVATIVPAAEALTEKLTALLERLTGINDSAVARIAAAETAAAEARAAQQDAAERAADADAARERAERQARINAAARTAAENEAAAAGRDAESARADKHRAEVAQAESERDARWLAEQLAELRQQHAELAGRHDQLEAQHASLTEAHAELGRARDTDRAAHTQAVHELELRHRDQLTDVRQAHAQELAEAERRHTADREQLTRRHHEETERLRADHTTALARLTTDLEQARARDTGQRSTIEQQTARLAEHERATAAARTLARDYAALFEVATDVAATDPATGRDIRAELAAALRGRSTPGPLG
ncbi:hypothetical protein [Amycolatopsis magusensis]|uniref:hypothetical protein n=1 Tax=Amycolatopsis magusensis TaxID=882444 RepID=UPI0024A9F9E5|nr:hypothetical protein [Amycolatopsis magusensis]MDI5980000.1 hypothetical protein [Amycolatopsis magusensis]